MGDLRPALRETEIAVALNKHYPLSYLPPPGGTPPVNWAAPEDRGPRGLAITGRMAILIFHYLDSSFLRMRRSSMKLSAVIAHSTDPNEIITIVSIGRGLLPRSPLLHRTGSSHNCRKQALALRTGSMSDMGMFRQLRFSRCLYSLV